MKLLSEKLEIDFVRKLMKWNLNNQILIVYINKFLILKTLLYLIKIKQFRKILILKIKVFVILLSTLIRNIIPTKNQDLRIV